MQLAKTTGPSVVSPTSAAPVPETKSAPGRMRSRLRAAFADPADSFGKSSAQPATPPTSAPQARAPATEGPAGKRLVDANGRESEIATVIHQARAGHPTPEWVPYVPRARRNSESFSQQMADFRRANGHLESGQPEMTETEVLVRRWCTQVAGWWRGLRAKHGAAANVGAPEARHSSATPGREV